MAITLTEAAAVQVRKVIDQNRGSLPNPDGVVLRMGVKGGGCAGFSHQLDLTDTVDDKDKVFETHGVKIVCDPKSYLYLNGTELDFKETDWGSGFIFNNPQSKGSCGCGSSFSA